MENSPTCAWTEKPLCNGLWQILKEEVFGHWSWYAFIIYVEICTYCTDTVSILWKVKSEPCFAGIGVI